MPAHARLTAFWPGILLAPAVFLADLTIAYALVPWACDHQRHGVLHATSLATLLLMLTMLLLAWRDWRSARSHDSAGMESLQQRPVFLAYLALTGSAVFTLATLALWFTQFIVPACIE